MLLLEVRDLVCSVQARSFANLRANTKKVLLGLSLTVEEGSSLALVGESGSGKSTLARCIAGLFNPESGTILFDGVNIFPDTRNRESVGIEIQLLFQGNSSSLDPTMNVYEILTEGILARDPTISKIREEAQRLLQSVGLEKEHLSRFPSQLSGGQRQRVALARILAAKPRLLILDEPTSALDVLTTTQLLSMLKSVASGHGITFLLITHDIGTALSCCSRIAILHAGSIVEQGTIHEVLQNPRHQYTRQLLNDSRMEKLKVPFKGSKEHRSSGMR